jgi:hypothetical protein
VFARLGVLLFAMSGHSSISFATAEVPASITLERFVDTVRSPSLAARRGAAV